MSNGGEGHSETSFDNDTQSYNKASAQLNPLALEETAEDLEMASWDASFYLSRQEDGSRADPNMELAVLKI